MEPEKKRTLFGDLAVSKGLVSQETIDEALEEQRRHNKERRLHKKIGTILIEKGALTVNDVKTILELQNPRTGLLAWISGLFNLSR